MRHVTLCIVVLCLLLPGCATLTPPVVPFRDGEVFALNVGEIARKGDGSVVVRFDAVTGDSRCPIGAVCVWSGQLTVLVAVGVALGQRTKTQNDACPGTIQKRA